MNSDDQQAITRQARRQVNDTMRLVEASLGKLQPFDPAHPYTPDEYEPYDALSDRFMRAVEIGINFFRSYERLQFAEESETFRDQLNRMEKLGLVTSVELWFRMREVRNRIVHDYSPEKVKELYEDMMGILGNELRMFARIINKLDF